MDGRQRLYASVWKVARLSRETWVDAAYARFSALGIDAVAVEPVARDLKATKGSFYWHFADRAELVSEVLTRWEGEETDAIMSEVGGIPSPRARLDELVGIVAHRTPMRGGEATLYTAAERNGISDFVTRVTERRVAFMTSVLSDIGLDPAEARRRALTVVAAVIGYQQLMLTGWRPETQSPTLMAASLVRMALGELADP